MSPSLLVIPAAYLLGSIPFGYLLVRTFRHQDIRATGSGNIGATNVARSGAKGLGVLTLLLDALKAAAAVLLARHLAPANVNLPIVAGLVALLGHIFPVWLGFRGGKGVACGLGVFAVLAPLSTGCAVLIFIVVVMLTRYVSLASLVASLLLPLIAWVLAPRFEPAQTAVWYGVALAIALVITVKHHANISRLLQGSEHRFGSRQSVKEVSA